MNTHTSHLNTGLGDITARRRAIQKFIIALKKRELSRFGYKSYSRLIRSLKRADLRLRHANFIFRLEHSSNHPPSHQILSPPQGSATSLQVRDSANKLTTLEPVAAVDSNASASAGATDNSDTKADKAGETENAVETGNADTSAGDAVETEPHANFIAGDVRDAAETSDASNTSEANHTGDAKNSDKTDELIDTRIMKYFNPYGPLEPEVLSSLLETELKIGQLDGFRCNTDLLQGACYGSFSSDNTHSIIAYGPSHLSAWSENHWHTSTDLTEFLPECRIKSVVPLSEDTLGIVADVGSREDDYKCNQMMLFDINAVLSLYPPLEPPPSFIWPALSHRSTGISKISCMRTNGDYTYFLSSGANSNKVHLHSFTQHNGAYTDVASEEFSARCKTQVNALCYYWKNSRAIIGSADGQISVVDGITSRHIYDGWLDENASTNRFPKITNLSICPTSPHLAMATCSTRKNQINIVDLRMPISPVLSCGMDLVSKYPEEIVPAWDPYSGVIVVPFNQNETEGKTNILSFIDTRFAHIRDTGPRNDCLSYVATQSVSFSTEEGLDYGMMVTAEADGYVRMSNYSKTA